MKRLLKNVCAGLLVAWGLVCSGTSALAEVDGNWEYSYYDSDFTATVTNYTGLSSSPTVPSKFSRRVNTGEKDEDGDYIYKTYTYKVTAISGTFRDNATITSVSLPSSVKSIGPYSFAGCSSLASLPIHSGITSIGASAFSGCINFKTVTLDANITSLGEAAFQGCNQIESVEINSPVTLPNDLFRDCSAITSVTIGNNVKGLGAATRYTLINPAACHPFFGCPNIKTFKVGSGVTAIPDYYFGERSNMLYYNCCFPAYATIEHIDLPDTITNIGVYAFSGCVNLDFGPPSFPDLVSIGDYAFKGCKLLEPFTFSDSLKSIGNSAFNGCVKFKEVTLDANITSLGEAAFQGCNQIESVEINSPVTLPNDLFRDCSAITSVTIGNNVKGLGAATRYTLINPAACHPFFGCPNIKTFKVGSGVTAIPDYYFGERSNMLYYNCCFPAYATIEHIDLPDTITNIGTYAFSGCNAIEQLVLPSHLANIGTYAFSNCRKLSSISFSSALSSIPQYCFASCSSLGNVKLPENLVQIDSYAFKSCASLSNVLFEGDVPTVGSSPFTGVASGARGYYPLSHQAAWKAVIGSDGKWQGLIMAEIPGPVLRVDSANPAEGSLTLAWDEPATVEGVTYSVYRSANDTYSATDLVRNGLTGTTWTDTAYWSAEPVLKPLNYWVVADGGGYGERASKPVKTRNRFGVFVGLNEEQGFATDARLCRNLAFGKGEFGDCTVFTGESVDSDVIRGKVGELAGKAQPGDLFLLYIATHGGEGSLSMSGWLDDYDVAELQTDVRKFNPGVAVIGVVMACHSGSMIGNGVGSEKIISWLLDAGAADCRANIAWVTSCGYGQVSPLYGNGGSTPTPFGCSFLRDGWQKGYADGPLFGTVWKGGNGDGKVTFYELARYAAEFNKGYSDDVAPAGVRIENDELLKRIVAGMADSGGTESQPDAPASCTASQGHSDASIQVKWELSKDATVDNYWLFRKGPGETTAHCVSRNAGNGEFFDPGTIRKIGESFWNPGGFSLKNLKPPEPFKIYTYYVRAVSPQGISEPSPEAMGFAGTTVMRQWLEALGISVAEGTGVASATMSANGHDSVLACYVAGLDPNDPNAAFTAELVREDGKWKAKPKDCEKEGRVYRVEGKKEMSDESWTDVTDVEDLEAEGWHFFRIGVELAE